MKRIFLTLTAAFGLIMNAQAGNYSWNNSDGSYGSGSMDSQGNYQWNNSDGSYGSGSVDSQGNYQWNDSNGNYGSGSGDPD